MTSEKKDPEERSPKETVFHDYQPRTRKEITNSRLNRAQERRSKTGHQEGLERKDLEPGELRTRSRAAKAGKEISRKTPLKNKIRDERR